MNSRTPNLVIVGAQRAGSTALAEALAEHPDVAISQPKEPSYFAARYGARDYSGPGDQWFARQNIVTLDTYLSLFTNDRQVVGEASAMYLALPGTAHDIAAIAPSAKVIALLRDPFRRAVSAHAYLLKQARESESNFTAGLRLEGERRASGWGPMWWYFGASDYAPALIEYRKAFGERLLVLTTERMKEDPHATLQVVLDFLGVDYSIRPAEFLASQVVNTGGAPRNKLLSKALYPSDTLRATIRKFSPEPVRNLIRNARNAATAPAPRVTPDDISASELAAFRDSAHRTAEVLNTDVGRLWPSARWAL